MNAIPLSMHLKQLCSHGGGGGHCRVSFVKTTMTQTHMVTKTIAHKHFCVNKTLFTENW